MGGVDHPLRTSHGLLEALAGDAVDTATGRGGDDLVATLAQNGDGLRADQAGAADDDDLHSLPPLSKPQAQRLVQFVKRRQELMVPSSEGIRRKVELPLFVRRCGAAIQTLVRLVCTDR